MIKNIALVLAGCMACTLAGADELPKAPEPQPGVTVSTPTPAALALMRPVPPTHRFLDNKNRLIIASVGASLVLDAVSTQRALERPGVYEWNPIARPFVSSNAGQSFYTAGSLAVVVGGMNFLHRRGHHKLERIWPLALTGLEVGIAVHNFGVHALPPNP